jgi:hypothetical protein
VLDVGEERKTENGRKKVKERKMQCHVDSLRSDLKGKMDISSVWSHMLGLSNDRNWMECRQNGTEDTKV